MINKMAQSSLIARSLARVILLGVVVGSSTAVQAQHHGGTIQKACVVDASVPVRGGSTTAQPGDPLRCTITFTNTDTFVDALRVDAIRDSVRHGGATTDDGACAAPPALTLPTCSAAMTGVNCVTPNLLLLSASNTTDLNLAPVTGTCVGGANNGASCTQQSDCLSRNCSVTIPFQQGIVVTHFDCADANDPPLLRDSAIELGTDLGILQ